MPNIHQLSLRRILDGFMHAAVPPHIVQSFTNAGISLVPDDDRVIRCYITPNTARRIIGTPFTDSLGNLVTDEEEE
jgi:hypothetical protein